MGKRPSRIILSANQAQPPNSTMKRVGLAILFAIISHFNLYSQYADLGSGSMRNQIWWFDWNGFTIANGASRVFNTPDGLTITVTFSNVQGPVCVPDRMNTWYGAVLHFLYEFSNTSIRPALHSPYTTDNSKFDITVTATRDGLPTPFTFVAADAEASAVGESIKLQSNGTNWRCIDFFRNNSQTSNPFLGCNTLNAEITDTYGGVAESGQNPVIATDALNSGSLTIKGELVRTVEGRSAVAFGIFAPSDRGDLPAVYGQAHHRLLYSTANPCNFLPPLPSTTLIQNLRLGSVSGDADPSQLIDDNINGMDEDALSFFPQYTGTGSYSLTIPVLNTTGNNAFLSAWLDVNRNQNFESNELAAVTVPNNATSATVTWTGLPAILPSVNTTFHAIRIRISSAHTAVQAAEGYAVDGEVEDYLVNIVPPVGTANFLLPETVCVGTPVSVQNLTEGATSFYWNFCSGSLNTSPLTENFTSPNLSMPVFMDIAQDGANYFAFVVNHTGTLSRLAYGNSLLNPPAIFNMGNFGGIIPDQAEGIEIQKDGSNWVGFIIGGQNANSRLVKLNFGNSLSNFPVAVNMGNVGGLSYPVDLTILYEEGNWYGFTVSADNNTVTKYSFGNSLNNAPTASNLGNIGNLDYPTGIFLIKSDNNYHLFITNRNSNSLSRLDFGTSIANTPTGSNLGNPGNNFNLPRDVTVIKDCDRIFGFLVNESNSIIRLDFASLTSNPATVSLGNIGSLSFPSSISDIVRTGDAVSFFSPNVNNNSISKFTFSNCNNASIASFAGATPPAFQYDAPGVYNVTLFVDDGLASQNVLCKKITVIDKPVLDFTFESTICDPLSLSFAGLGAGLSGHSWSFGDNASGTQANPQHSYGSAGDYVIQFSASNGYCRDTITKTISLEMQWSNLISTTDTTICIGTTKQLLTTRGLSFCWSPISFLDNPNVPNPVTSTPTDITYYYTAEVTGTNLITNGDFSQGNTGFTSSYTYNPTSGVSAAVYTVGSNVIAWHPTMTPCSDHTTGTGNMMMVNGAEIPGVNVWSQTVAIQPNTNYAFSAWLQHITIINPATLQFSINGTPIGSPFQASNTSCLWEQFYTTWNSGSNTSAVISIINKNELNWGNDFALDDISFAPVFTRRDSVKISVDTPAFRTIDDLSVCPGTPVTLQTTGASVYSWTPAATLSNAGIANPIATPTSTTQYIVTGTNAFGCIAKDTVNVAVYPKPTITKSANTSVCLNTSVQLFASGGIGYAWTPTNTLDNPTASNPFATPSETTMYYVTVTDANTCTNTDSIEVAIVPDPVFALSPGQSICVNDTISLTASGGDIYVWAPSSTLNNTNIATPKAFPTNTTTYSVTITDLTCNVSDVLTTTVTVNPLPIVAVSKANDIDCTNSSSQLNATGASSYSWSPAGSLDNSTIANPLATPTAATHYTVIGTDALGCRNSDTITVHFSGTNPGGYYMPTAFSPNYDGLNDCYSIKYWGAIQELEFSIYNRWGERIFFTKNPSDCWNGKYKGQDQDIGVYVYMIKAKTLCGDTFKKGLFTLIR